MFLLVTLFNILPTVTGQMGPNYDPLFFDVMTYIFAAIILIIIVIIAIIVFLVIRKKIHVKPQMGADDTQFWVCPVCGNDTKEFHGKSYCSYCNKYL